MFALHQFDIRAREPKINPNNIRNLNEAHGSKVQVMSKNKLKNIHDVEQNYDCSDSV